MRGCRCRYKSWLLLAALLQLSSTAQAQISVTPSIVVFEAGGQRTMVVANQADAITFVTVRPRIVTAPGHADEKLMPEPNPGQLGLLVTPIRMALEPGERRGVNLTPLSGPGASDRVWRVQVAPAVGPLKPGEVGLSFIIAYDALVIQRADAPQVSVAGNRSGDSLTLTNSGNSFAMITSIEQCEKPDNCATLPAKRLYAGQSWTVVLPMAGEAATVHVEGVRGRRETLSF